MKIKSLLFIIILVTLFYSATPHADIPDGGEIQINDFVTGMWTISWTALLCRPALLTVYLRTDCTQRSLFSASLTSNNAHHCHGVSPVAHLHLTFWPRYQAWC
ncbi:hypothetical protein [Salmonella enterica]|uniref:hypothetical protein n=1 Tax=Salmonella enterica TaxID=28901 RepID=UPI0026BB250D|nr:hypothetical protein [Salmonella enterica]